MSAPAPAQFLKPGDTVEVRYASEPGAEMDSVGFAQVANNRNRGQHDAVRVFWRQPRRSIKGTPNTAEPDMVKWTHLRLVACEEGGWSMRQHNSVEVATHAAAERNGGIVLVLMEPHEGDAVEHPESLTSEVHRLSKSLDVSTSIHSHTRGFSCTGGGRVGIPPSFHILPKPVTSSRNLVICVHSASARGFAAL